MESEKVYINGRIVALKGARVSVSDRGLNYGDGLFETMKAYKGRVFLLKEHLERLGEGAGFLAIPSPDGAELEQEIERLLKINNLTRNEAYIKILLTRGEDRGVLLPIKGIKPTVIITARRLDTATIKRMQGNGVDAFLLGERLNPPLISTLLKRGIKSLNYLPNVLGKIEASRKKAYEGIFTKGRNILEGTSTNVFIVKGGVIKTPPTGRGTGILAGVMRKAVMSIAMEKGIPLRQAEVKVSELKKSDEAFLTNSIVEVLPLVRVDSFKIGNGKAGSITMCLQKSLKDLATGANL
ncbi:MAG: aminotransferase class IV [Deltaproteobacteria bacterium]|nr:aminotransferase class IV [Deltaproteobacteria bacterium]